MKEFRDSFPEPDDDPALDEAFSLLKRLEPPLEARIANRQAVSAALDSFQAVNWQRDLPWWRRSVSIPVPLAAALGLLMAVLLYASVRHWQERSAALVAASGASLKETDTTPSDAAALAPPKSNNYPTWKHYETEVYLCGVGRVNSESYCAAKE